MEAFLISAGAVLLGEIGDKTMLLALVLATRFRKPGAVIAGIFVATLFNHALAGVIGGWLRAIVPTEYLPWLVGLSFIAVGLWALIRKPGTRKQPSSSGSTEGSALAFP